MRIQKRPLFHPAIPSPHAGPSQQKVVYISTNTPFMSAVTRVRKTLAIMDKRSISNEKSRAAALARVGDPSSRQPHKEPIVLKATNRAIEKTLGLALFFQQQAGFAVRIRTGTISVVDDVVLREGRNAEPAVEEAAVVVPETQIRRMSTVEVEIRMV